ncbi:SET domain-containing protein [Dothidotthia symphoricarpi CBS 119687]|uniref:SET domain-containing protein n=1 Tax=Dothidotthia symphoricarpi CBS 119687 TaxID=1392245 RepID=A0A6A6AF26_9PLEO|nr:SET domain-containing protein [Dothidotthia symphoricarpi CBS 119687]KAF2129628.1 SET domain-containing protein [Dothidotthia symphoricarpi CBS 119687]
MSFRTICNDFRDQTLFVNQEYRELVEWAINNGAFIHPSCEFHASPGGGGTVSVKMDSQTVEPNAVLLRMPYCLSLSYFNAITAGIEGSHYVPRSKPLPAAFLQSTADHETIGNIFLVQQYLLGNDSFWHPYIQVLPQPDTSSQPAIPLLWNKEDTVWLQGTHLEEATKDRRKHLKNRWHEAMNVLKQAGWDISGYTIELFMWADFCFTSRQFPSVALAGDAASLKPEYKPLFEDGISSDDGPRILLPLLDGINHVQEGPSDWHYDKEGLAIAKSFEMQPGEEICYPYDTAGQRLNNTVLFRDFGFIIPNNEACEATLTFPFDPTIVMHPSHSVFSLASTVEECYSSAEYAYVALVSIRSPTRDPRGPLQPNHEVPDLSHFHPQLVSMVSFRVANLVERVALRENPTKLPTERLKKATVEYLVRHIRGMLQTMKKQGRLLKTPQNEQQRRACAYRQEQIEILEDVMRTLNTT